MIMFSSEEAAQYKTNLSGWVSRGGRYWGNDERAARYDGCTHRPCEDCGGPAEKGWLVCPKCRENRDISRYKAMPREEWDEVGMLYSDAYSEFYSSWEEIEEFCVDEGIGIDKMRLIICEPQYLPLLNNDYGCDSLAEDAELPSAILHAIDEFNKVVRGVGVVSWVPGKKAAGLTTQEGP